MELSKKQLGRKPHPNCSRLEPRFRGREAQVQRPELTPRSSPPYSPLYCFRKRESCLPFAHRRERIAAIEACAPLCIATTMSAVKTSILSHATASSLGPSLLPASRSSELHRARAPRFSVRPSSLMKSPVVRWTKEVSDGSPPAYLQADY